MHIIIGSTGSVDAAGKRTEGPAGTTVEARILQSRPSRRRRGQPPEGQNERRSGGSGQDPEGGMVLLLMIPEGHKLPKDLSSGSYRVFLRFTRRGA
ncbi:MAG: hypothetical protein ABFD98_14030 [Syntrophobacteraceae bacterium]